jgi:hypothetical protein
MTTACADLARHDVLAARLIAAARALAAEAALSGPKLDHLSYRRCKGFLQTARDLTLLLDGFPYADPDGECRDLIDRLDDMAPEGWPDAAIDLKARAVLLSDRSPPGRTPPLISRRPLIR